MKKLFFILLAISSIWLWSCEEEEDLSVKNLQVYVISNPWPKDSVKNYAVLTAVANNALSYTWDLGIDSTATGMQVTVLYPRVDTFYVIKCTAKGAVDEISVTDTVRWK